METIDKVINVRTNYKELISGMTKVAKAVDGVSDRISDLKARLKGLKAERKAAAIDEERYHEQVARTTQELIANRKEVKALQTAMRSYSREIQDNIQEEKNLEGAVNSVCAAVRSLTAEYNALSAADREGAVGSGLVGRIAQMQTQVGAAEQRLSDFRANAGNYQSAFNGLNLSVAQFVRNLPAATRGANLFFLAVSDNIPQLVAEINKLRAANKQAAQEGKQGVPILKQLGAAVFSWNSLLSIGTTLLSVYGDDIVSWIGNLFKGRAAAMTMAEAQAEVNKQMETSAGNYGNQVAQLRALQLQWNQLGEDLQAKTAFVKNNQEAFDKLGVALTTVADADHLFTQNTDAFIEAMRLRAQANAANELATQKYKDALLARQKAEDKIKEGATETIWKSANGAGSYKTQVRREYTEDEKKELFAEAEALEAEASAFTQLTVARDADAKSILDRAGIEESGKDSKKKEKEATQTGEARSKAIEEAKTAALKAEEDYFRLVQQLRDKTKAGELATLAEQHAAEKAAAESRIAETEALLKTAEGEQSTWLLQEKETLNTRILALDEKYQKDRIAIDERYSEEALRKELAREEARIRARLGMDAQMDALARAQVKRANYSDLESDDPEKRLSAQQAVAQEELRITMDKYQALLSMDDAAKETLYNSEVEYQTAVLNGEMAVQDAKKETARITEEQANYQRNVTLSAMSTISGAAANLFNTLAEDHSEFAEFAKLLALFNIGVNTALAISEAIAGNAARPIKMAVAIAAVLSAIAQAYQVLNQAEKPSTPKFARGGLVTGPGTGTSDSIPARLSHGEAVMTARAVVDWGPVLSMMNVSSGGNAIPTQHLPERGSGVRQMEQMFERVLRRLPNPVVTVKDINSGQRRVKVQDETARYTGRKR